MSLSQSSSLKKGVIALLVVILALVAYIIYLTFGSEKIHPTLTIENTAVTPINSTLGNTTTTPPLINGAGSLVDSVDELVGENNSFPFALDDGYRIYDASNPRIMSYEDSTLTLGYEYRSSELKNTPGEKGYIAVSHDHGLTFEEGRQFQNDEQHGKGVLMPDGKTYRRYVMDLQNGLMVSESSTDRDTWTDDSGARYDLNEHDEGWAGVYTIFVDGDGGVVLLYNNDIVWEETGEKIIYVRRAYSKPGDNGMNFEFEDDDVMEMQHSDGTPVSWADPHAAVASDGSIRLVVMHQERGKPFPPKGRTGDIYTFVSTDGGNSFTVEGKALGWEEIDAYTVFSLNDPKIIQLEDGRFRFWVAAMVYEGELTDTESLNGEDPDFHWLMLSATTAQ